MRVTSLAANRRPSLDAACGPEVGPLGEVGLAQDDRPRPPQQGHDIGVPARGMPVEQAGSGGAGQTAGVDIVLDHDRDTVQTAAPLAGRVPSIGLPGLAYRGGIHSQDRVQIRIARVDPVQAVPGQLHARQPGADQLHVQRGNIGQRRFPAALSGEVRHGGHPFGRRGPLSGRPLRMTGLAWSNYPAIPISLSARAICRSHR